MYMDLINELYIGDSSLVLAENELSKFRKKYIKKNCYNKAMGADLHLLKFNRIIEDIFGFNTFSLCINYDATFNAFTFPLGSRIGIGSTKLYNGLKFNKDYKYSAIVFINSGIITSTLFTDKEIMAIILHEIGHNFNTTVLATKGSIYSLFDQLLNIISLLVTPLYHLDIQSLSISNVLTATNYIKFEEKIRTEHKKLYSGLQLLNTVYNTVGTIFDIANLFNSVKYPIEYIKRNLKLLIYKLLSSIFIIPPNYNNEKLSDTFVTIYGYGQYLSSSLVKMTNMSTVHENTNNIMTYILNLIIFPITIIINIIDPHPSTITRIKTQYDYLEKELQKNNIDEKLLNQLLSNKQEIYNQLSIILNTSKNSKIMDMYSKYIIDNFNGDFRELFINLDINKVYDNI